MRLLTKIGNYGRYIFIRPSIVEIGEFTNSVSMGRQVPETTKNLIRICFNLDTADYDCSVPIGKGSETMGLYKRRE